MNEPNHIYNAWRDSEAYQLPMTEEGDRLASQRWRGFQKGWEYAEFYAKHGHVYKKDVDENKWGDEDDI